MAERGTEDRHILSDGIQSIAGTDVLSRILTSQQAALTALLPAFAQIVEAAEACTAALRQGGKMGYAGAGSSGLMALADCLELPGTFGIAPDRVPMLFAGGAAALLHMEGGVEDDPNLALADLNRAGLGKGDAILCLAASGRTPYTLTVAKEAKARGTTVIGLANVPGAELLSLADIPILLDTGAEIVTGSTRMGAGTVQKIALNMISVLVGIGLGHAHDGYMVNLTADNIKLIDRAARIVAAVSGSDLETAKAALQQTHGAVKPAIVVAQGKSPDEAKAALKQSHGHLAPVLRVRP